jgi:hypothetical protein
LLVSHYFSASLYGRKGNIGNEQAISEQEISLNLAIVGKSKMCRFYQRTKMKWKRGRSGQDFGQVIDDGKDF